MDESGGAGPTLDTVAAEFLARAGLIATMSGFRYWRRLADICEERLSPLARVGLGSAPSEEERRRLAEELRGLARELGEAASREARRFQADLERLAAGLAASPNAPAASAPRRYARAKA
ncbi:MAG: hypothetical protein ABI369_06195 [Acetobacteraceae bacterium]